MTVRLNRPGCDWFIYFKIIIGIKDEKAPKSPHRKEKKKSYPLK
jgi:hypothetical protein